MATFEVCGPHTIRYRLSGTGTYTSLGRGDNDDLFRIETETSYVEITTNEGGTMPIEAIRTGMKVSVFFSLIDVERTAIDTMLQGSDGNSGSTAGTYYPPGVGTVLKPGISGDTTFDLQLLPDTTSGGQKTVTVFRCRLTGLTQQDFGNKPTRMAFKAEAMVDQDSIGSAMYTIT